MARKVDFNPRAPCGARPRWRRWWRTSRNFNPRAPCGARQGLSDQVKELKDFNPRAPCGARLCTHRIFGHESGISTHAPLAGRDEVKTVLVAGLGFISTHAPLAGRDRPDCGSRPRRGGFQPTRPLRGATPSESTQVLIIADFNPRAPCGARRRGTGGDKKSNAFQPTRPLRGATPRPDQTHNETQRFQPTRPLRGATSHLER